ncbi:hypothetical protein EOA32_28595 [Mesorhizobium sp. M1A.F.Ca.ET.072.01.1.1]|nr:hypothetical protein EOA32_28595 [Mesorhizobium sp. M1A.F.Ca.ET.072.01.1.1]
MAPHTGRCRVCFSVSGRISGHGVSAQVVPWCHGAPKASRTSGPPKMLAHFGSPTRRLRRSLGDP